MVILLAHIACSFGLDCGACSVAPSSFTMDALGEQQVCLSYLPTMLTPSPEQAAATLHSEEIGTWEYRLEGWSMGRFCLAGW